MNREAMKKYGVKPFDFTKYLDGEETIQAYLSSVLKDGETEEFIRALGYIAKARSINDLAAKHKRGKNV